MIVLRSRRLWNGAALLPVYGGRGGRGGRYGWRPSLLHAVLWRQRHRLLDAIRSTAPQICTRIVGTVDDILDPLRLHVAHVPLGVLVHVVAAPAILAVQALAYFGQFLQLLGNAHCVECVRVYVCFGVESGRDKIGVMSSLLLYRRRHLSCCFVLGAFRWLRTSLRC